MKLEQKSGFSLIEAVLAASIFGLVVTTLIGAIIYAREGTSIATTRDRATLIAEEAIEAVRNLRDENFANLIDGTYGLSSSSGRWVLSGAADVFDIFTRQIQIGTVSSGIKIVTSTVTWNERLGRQGQVSLSARITKWPFPLPWVVPTQGASLDLAGINDGLKVQVQGNYAYLIRNDGTPDFAIVDISNPANPILAGSLSLTGIPANIAVSGNYAYAASRDNNQELQIINISNPLSPSVVGTFNAAGTADAVGVYVVGTTVYLVRLSSTSDELIVINAINPAAPSLYGSLNLNANANEIFVSGNYAYIASGHNTQELQVVNIANPLTPAFVASLDLPGTVDATAIWGFGSSLLIGQGTNLRTIDITAPTSPVLRGSLGVGGTINELVTDGSNSLVFLATANASQEFQVVDIRNFATPTLFGSLNLAFTPNGVAYSPTLNRVFLATPLNTGELIVIAPE